MKGYSAAAILIVMFFTAAFFSSCVSNSPKKFERKIEKSLEKPLSRGEKIIQECNIVHYGVYFYCDDCKETRCKELTMMNKILKGFSIPIDKLGDHQFAYVVYDEKPIGALHFMKYPQVNNSLQMEASSGFSDHEIAINVTPFPGRTEVNYYIVEPKSLVQIEPGQYYGLRFDMLDYYYYFPLITK